MTETPGADALYFLPLGGTGEIGMNLNLYGHDGQWLMIDLGITFSDPRIPGVDVFMPDPAFIEERREQLAGLVLTHAHEDHIGAVAHLWPRLQCPVYATPFTASMVLPKLRAAGLDTRVEITEVPLSGRFTVGPFELELITLTHSIPEPNAVVIRTAAGTVLHTGDWKLDPEPLVGESYDEEALRALADEDVLAMVCDSTNALVDGDSGSEAEVRETLMSLVAGLENRVAVACFASNVARLETMARVAQATGRRMALVGRSMHRVFAAAQDNGYLTGLPPMVAEEDIGYLPRGEVLLVCTGSQGEPGSALWRIANDENRHVSLESGDAVVFSSRIIPGNDVSIFTLQNQLVRQGLEIITDDDHFIHVSGHPARDELTQMYQWVRPRVAVPVHGEARHLFEHARLAEECQIPEQIVGENGSLIQLAPGPARIIDHVPSGRLAYDGKRLLRSDNPVFRTRQRMIFNGAAAATLVLGADGKPIDDPQITVQGLIDPDLEGDLLAEAAAAARKAVAALRKAARQDDAEVVEIARQAIRRTFNRALGKKPVTSVHLVRLDI